MKINLNKLRPVYILISSLAILVSLVGFAKWGLPLGVDFTGGANIEYKTEKITDPELIMREIEKEGIKVTSVQKTIENTYLVRLESLGSQNRQRPTEILKNFDENISEIKYEDVGPSIGPELIKKTVIAMALASLVILFWIANQFKSTKAGLAAIIAVLHDCTIVVGSFIIMGKLWGAQIDFLFVTALLTTLSFSVHDTIVVFDRIREIKKKHGGSISDVADTAVTQTMRRSINNSLTIIIMLASLTILGGGTIKWFTAALLVGTISGTYSSPFVAVPIFVALSKLKGKRKN